MGDVYLLHLDTPVGHARHYTGWGKIATERFKDHLAGRGGRLLKVANSRGITYQLVRVWTPADRRFERRVKNYAAARKLCPLCNPATWKTCLPVVNDAKKRQKPERKNDHGKAA
jgi:predicted GIY-YIG superfamily endonuclease